MSDAARLRSMLEEQLVAALQADFEAHGADALTALRAKDPGAYVRAVLAKIPGVRPAPATMDELSDDEVSAVLIAVRKTRRVREGAGRGAEEAVRGERVVAVSAIPKASDVS